MYLINIYSKMHIIKDRFEVHILPQNTHTYRQAHWVLPPLVSFPPYSRNLRSASFYRKQRYPEAPEDENVRGPKTFPWIHTPFEFRPSREQRHSYECNLDTIFKYKDITYGSITISQQQGKMSRSWRQLKLQNTFITIFTKNS